MADDVLTLEELNAATREQFAALLTGIYEHSPWIAEVAWDMRPFTSLAHLKRALVDVVRDASEEAKLALVRAHPELAGKAMIAKTLTSESTNEQSTAGLANCSPGEFATLQSLNRAYNEKFHFPFMLAVRGPRGTGLTRAQIIETFIRRLANAPDFELAEALRHVHRIAELRLADRFDVVPVDGNEAWDWAEQLAAHTEAQGGQLTVTYLTGAHRAVARQLETWMHDCGFDRVTSDAVGNVIGIYDGDAPDAPILMTGSHYDTVRNGGKYDGRLGIFAPMLSVSHLSSQGRRLPFGIEVVGFAEEEGQRFKATFLGSAALIGAFDAEWLDQVDRDGTTMREAMQRAGLPATMDAIAQCARDPAKYLGFVEVHIEQGPVLNDLDLPLGVVTSINGSVRFTGEILGTMSHAGTTPMTTRRDAATAVAELALYLEKRAAREPDLVGTMGMLNVPNGSINVVPGRVQFTLDIRATTDASRDACAADVLAELKRICERRNLAFTVDESMRASAAPSAPAWARRWERAVAALGLPVHRMPSGAGHDAMKMHEALPQAMLFVRGLNAGISHNPLESSTADDMQLAIDAFDELLEGLALETPQALSAMATSAGELAENLLMPASASSDGEDEPMRAAARSAASGAPSTFTSSGAPARGAELTTPSPARPVQRAGAEPTYARLDAWIDAHFPSEVAFLQALVQVPTDTPPGDNAPHAVRTAELLEGFGLTAEHHPVPDADVKAAGMQSITNLIVRRRFGIGPTIALNAHGDVVPPGDGWRHAPYGGEIADGKLFGRASAVSKSDFATYTFALRALDALEVPLAGAIELHFTYDEEFGGELGPGRLLKEGLTKPDLLLAAGFSYQVVTAHNGCLQMEVTVHGKMAHAAIPATGVDALQGAVAVLNALYAQNEIYRGVTSKVEGITHPYLNVGRIEGGTNTNVVPGKVVLKLDRRMIPEEDPVEVEATIRRVIADATATRPGITVEIKRLLLARSLQPLPGNAPLVEALQHHGEAVLGEPIPTSGTPLYTDVRLYGEAGVPAAIYGAGPRTVFESNAKRADEHVVLEDLRRATQVVARTLYDLLTPRRD